MKLALGTAQFGLAYGVANQSGQLTQEQVREVLAVARAAGVDMLDTAIAYGNSEESLGLAGVANWQVISKLPPLPESVAEPGAWVSAQIAGSLQRLRIPQLRGLLLHRPSDLLGVHGPAIARALQEAKARGYVERVGVSVYAPAELEPLLALGGIDMVQAPLSVVDQRMISSGWITRLQDQSIEFHARSIFLQGLLLMSPEVRPVRFAAWQDLWLRWAAWLQTHQVSALQACLHYALNAPCVSRVVLGVDSAHHLRQILEAAASKQALAAFGPPDLVDEKLLNPALWPKAA
jgi:aryl-alcohol dehydrogenase-like predicted oxidoreductase